MDRRHRRSNAPWLETLRLELREFMPDDLPDLVRLDTDPRVLKFIGDGKAMTHAAIEAGLRRIQRYPKLYPDLGLWHASRRDTGEFIGWFSLKYAGKSPDVEIGYRLCPSAWGQGFATEGAAALRDYGFDDVGLERIIGVTHPDHTVSQRVLMKIGMRDEGWGHYYNHRLRLFAIRNPHS